MPLCLIPFSVSLLHFLSFRKIIETLLLAFAILGALFAPETHSSTVCHIKRFCHVMLFYIRLLFTFCQFPYLPHLIHRQRILTPTYWTNEDGDVSTSSCFTDVNINIYYLSLKDLQPFYSRIIRKTCGASISWGALDQKLRIAPNCTVLYCACINLRVFCRSYMLVVLLLSRSVYRCSLLQTSAVNELSLLVLYLQ